MLFRRSHNACISALSMKKFSLAAIAAACLIIAGLPVNAGLGSATSKTKSSSYDCFCGEKGNDCKVSFSNGKITVNDTDSVDFEDITYITRNYEYNEWSGVRTYTFGVEYLEEGMDDPEFAEIILIHKPTALKFWRDLRRACRNCKDRDATQVDVDVNLKD